MGECQIWSTQNGGRGTGNSQHALRNSCVVWEKFQKFYSKECSCWFVRIVNRALNRFSNFALNTMNFDCVLGLSVVMIQQKMRVSGFVFLNRGIVDSSCCNACSTFAPFNSM